MRRSLSSCLDASPPSSCHVLCQMPDAAAPPPSSRVSPHDKLTAPRASSRQSRDRIVAKNITFLCGFTLSWARILHTVPCRSARHACASTGPWLASLAGQKSRRPKFVGIAEVLGLPARQRHRPCLGVQRNRQFPAGAIVERRHRAFGHGAFDAALDRLMTARAPELPQTQGLPDRPEYPHPLDPDCRLGSRLRDRFYFADARRHAAMTYTALHIPHYDNVHGIGRLGSFRQPGNPIRRC
jgi:hypothetical protein